MGVSLTNLIRKIGTNVTHHVWNKFGTFFNSAAYPPPSIFNPPWIKSLFPGELIISSSLLLEIINNKSWDTKNRCCLLTLSPRNTSCASSFLHLQHTLCCFILKNIMKRYKSRSTRDLWQNIFLNNIFNTIQKNVYLWLLRYFLNYCSNDHITSNSCFG